MVARAIIAVFVKEGTRAQYGSSLAQNTFQVINICFLETKYSAAVIITATCSHTHAHIDRGSLLHTPSYCVPFPTSVYTDSIVVMLRAVLEPSHNMDRVRFSLSLSRAAAKNLE